MPKETLVTRRALFIRAAVGVSGAALISVGDACGSLPATRLPEATGQPVRDARSTLIPGQTDAAVLKSATSATAPPPATVTPRSGGTLRYGNIGDYATLDGQTTNLLLYDNVYSVWDRLTFYDANLHPQPMLAESWETSPDQRQITFHLRKGVQFHTRRELTSSDVKWSLERLHDPKIGSTLTGRAEVMTNVDAPDAYTVVVTAARPWVEAFDLFDQANIIDPVTFQSAGLMKPTGTGPFEFVEYVQGDHLRLKKNPSYWRRDRPYLEEVVVSIFKDAQGAVIQLETGAIDLLGFGLPVTDAVRLRSEPGFQVAINEASGSSWVVFANATQAPTDNKFLRQAINFAIDRQRMAETVWHGLAHPLTLPWSRSSPAYDATRSQSVGFDLNKARSLLAQSGLSGVRLDIGWSTSTADFSILAQILQADLAKIGVETALKPLEPAVYVSTRNNKSFNGLLFGPGPDGNAHPGTVILGGNYGPSGNFAGFSDAAYGPLADLVLAETDPAKQNTLYAQLNDYLLDQAWVMPIVQSPEHHARKATVQGLRYDAHEALVLADVWLS